MRLLSKDPEWLSAKVKFFLPNMDLGSGDQSPDPTQRVIQQLSKLHTQGQSTWQEFIHCVCMELDIPLDLEVPLLSIWGHGDGKSGREKWGAREAQARPLPVWLRDSMAKPGTKFHVSAHLPEQMP